MIFFRVNGQRGSFTQGAVRDKVSFPSDPKMAEALQKIYDEYVGDCPAYTDPELERTRQVMKWVGGEVLNASPSKRARYRRTGAAPPWKN